jgi:hypothetical protein
MMEVQLTRNRAGITLEATGIHSQVKVHDGSSFQAIAETEEVPTSKPEIYLCNKSQRKLSVLALFCLGFCPEASSVEMRTLGRVEAIGPDGCARGELGGVKQDEGVRPIRISEPL